MRLVKIMSLTVVLAIAFSVASSVADRVIALAVIGVAVSLFIVSNEVTDRIVQATL